METEWRPLLNRDECRVVPADSTLPDIAFVLFPGIVMLDKKPDRAS